MPVVIVPPPYRGVTTMLRRRDEIMPLVREAEKLIESSAVWMKPGRGTKVPLANQRRGVTPLAQPIRQRLFLRW